MPTYSKIGEYNTLKYYESTTVLRGYRSYKQVFVHGIQTTLCMHTALEVQTGYNTHNSG